MGEQEVEGALAAAAALADPLRRRLYRFVGTQDHAVSRDEAAEAVGSSRSAAAFHLDRLAAEGLLETEFRRLSGRAGPGAGRPSKLYRRGWRDIALNLPPRRYDLAADMLASAVAESTVRGAPAGEALGRLARARGAELAAPVGGTCGRRPNRAAEVRAAADVLTDLGYEPLLDGPEVVLSNCPFRSLVPGHTALVCGMNLALLEGFAGALPGGAVTARLEPAAGRCCVRLDLNRPTRRRN
ncbi:MAG: transcriptional regulator [Actinobacteria bacterium]|nr:transcriptional regulator [Actinomycetota bacterium]